MWKMIISELSQRAIHKGQKVIFLGTIKAVVQNIYHRGRAVKSAYFSPSTRAIFRSESARYTIFIQMSKEMWDFDSEGSGEIMFNKVINGFLPDLFKRWTKMKARHLVSIVLFCRVEYNFRNSNTALGTELSKLNLKAYSVVKDTRDFYRVVVSETASEDWVNILNGLKREFLVFLRDVSIVRNPFYESGNTPDKQDEVPEFIIAGHPSSSSKSNILEAINLASSQFSRGYIDRDLVRTGVSIIVISAGSGIYDVDYNTLKLTTDSLTVNGIGVDLVCLSNIPLHSVPLFRYRRAHSRACFVDDAGIAIAESSTPRQKQSMKTVDMSDRSHQEIIHSPSSHYFQARIAVDDTWVYAMPHWLDISFWKYPVRGVGYHPENTSNKGSLSFTVSPGSGFTPRCRMYDLLMMGLMENNAREISIPYLKQFNSYQHKSSRDHTVPISYDTQLSAQANIHNYEREKLMSQDLFSTSNYDDNLFSRRRPFQNFRKETRWRKEKIVPIDSNHKDINGTTNYDSSQESSYALYSNGRRLQASNDLERSDDSVAEIQVDSVGTRTSQSSNITMEKSYRVNRQLSFGLGGFGAQKAVASTGVTDNSRVLTDFTRDSESVVSKTEGLSVSSKVKASLTRKFSQHSVTGTVKSLADDKSEKRPSQPISIQHTSRSQTIGLLEGNRVKSSDRNPYKAVKDVNNMDILNAVSITKQAGPRMRLIPDNNTTSHHPTVSSPSEDTLPWFTIANPSNPKEASRDSTGHYRRWQHVFPRPLRLSAMRWKSLCSPAAVPLTSEFFPSHDHLAREYQESFYKISQNEDDELFDSRSIIPPLMSELVAFRLSHGFQLVVGNAASSLAPRKQSVFSKDYTSEAGDIVFMTAGNTMHQLQCLSTTEVEVRRYWKKVAFSDTSPNSADEKMNYEPYIRSASGTTYHQRVIPVKSPVEEYNWNYIDNYLAGYRDTYSDSLRFWRTRFVLIPLQISHTYHETVEETQLDGIKCLTQLWQKYRFISAEEKQLHPLPKKQKDPNPLAIDFQTRDPSKIVAAAFSGFADTISLPESEPTLYPHGSEESEIYQAHNYDLQKLAMELQGEKGINIKDRRWHFTLHHHCFIGSEMATWLLQNFDIETRDDAADLGNRLMEEGLFQHVTRRHQFKDGNYFYQISGEYRMPKSEPKNSWFRSNKKAAATSRPTAELRSESTESLESKSRSSTEFSIDAAEKKTPTKSTRTSTTTPPPPLSKRTRFVLSRVLRYDVDHRKKSYRPEIVNLHYDLLHNPTNCYHIRIDWMNVTAKLIDDAIVSWASIAEKHHLNLVEVPIAEGSCMNQSHPFRSPYTISLAMNPAETEGSRNGFSKSLGSLFDDKFYYQKKILHEHLFVLDYEAASSFPAGSNVTFSWGKPDYKYDQYIHQSGMVLAQINETGKLLVMANRLSRNQAGGAGKEGVRVSRRSDQFRHHHHHQVQDEKEDAEGTSGNKSPELSPNVFARSAGGNLSGQNRPSSIHATMQASSSSSANASSRKTLLTPEQIIGELDAFCNDAEVLARFYEEVSAEAEEGAAAGSMTFHSCTSSPLSKPMSKGHGREGSGLQALALDTTFSKAEARSVSTTGSGTT